MDQPIPFGRYELMSRLAAGGMAELFVARQRSVSGFEKQLVIKRILAGKSQDPDFVRMFLDEARVAATLDHPNIVQIYDVGHVGDEYFIAMELIEGKNLVELLRTSARIGQPGLPLAPTLTVAAAACAGLHYAHEKRDFDGRPLGIVHRDVTPQNIMITFDGGVKIVDFGIAKAASREVETAVGTLKGKLGYMSPEQCRGLNVDRRSDVFALGVVLYELTTGKRLYREKTEFETLKKIIEGPVPSLRAADPTVPEELDEIVARCLQKAPEDRYQDARALHAALEQLGRRLGLAMGTVALAQFIERMFPDAGNPPLLPLEPEDPSLAAAVPRPVTGYFGESSRHRSAPIAAARRKEWVRRAQLGAAAAAIAALAATVAWRVRPTDATTTAAPVAAASATAPASSPPIDGIDAARLTGKGDAAPSLLNGKPPVPPATALPLSPTIVCRILVAPDGTVARAQIFRSRLELTPYEDAALQAVQRYRFTPARRGGQPVAAWINWPVRFAN